MDYSNVLSTVKPTTRENEKVMNIAYSVINKLKLKAKPLLGGSVAKGTWLKGNNDIDIYIRFPLEYKGKDISRLLENSLKSFKNVKKVHGSRDYFQLIVNGFMVELIPILEIDSSKDAMNITDISPLHIAWVTKSVLKNPKLQDEIRLAKAFLKAAGIYGAESYINGFSGYATEILVIYYKGFENFIKAISKWKGKTVIDTAGLYNDNPLLHLNPAKISSNLILIDPVQKERNAASSVSNESIEKLVNAAKEFVKKPSASFFKEEKANASLLSKKGYIVIQFKPLGGSDDVIGTKIYKCYLYLKSALNIKGFGVKDSGFDFDGVRGLAWIKPENSTLPDKMKHQGPPETVQKALLGFIIKWGKSKVKVEQGRSYVMVDREFTDARKLIIAELKSDYIKERIESYKLA